MAESSSSKSLEKAWASLSLEDDDALLVLLEEELTDVSERDQGLTLVGHFAIEKPIKFQIMRETMSSIWRPGKGVNISEVSSNLYLFQFYHEVDLNRILEDGLWSYE